MVTKITSSNPGPASPRTETLSGKPAVNGHLFRIVEGWGSGKRGMGSAFQEPGFSGPLTPATRKATKLLEIFTFQT